MRRPHAHRHGSGPSAATRGKGPAGGGDLRPGVDHPLPCEPACAPRRTARVSRRVLPRAWLDHRAAGASYRRRPRAMIRSVTVCARPVEPRRRAGGAGARVGRDASQAGTGAARGALERAPWPRPAPSKLGMPPAVEALAHGLATRRAGRAPRRKGGRCACRRRRPVPPGAAGPPSLAGRAPFPARGIRLAAPHRSNHLLRASSTPCAPTTGPRP
jgi:hypothetical protein